MITSSVTLDSFIEVAPRFSRSVHLEKDFKHAGGLRGYVLTSTARVALQRMSASLRPDGTQRAWSLTGPYGSGKSAFALFLAHLLDHHGEQGSVEARTLLRENDSTLYRSLFDKRHKGAISSDGFIPVLITGTREPLALALLRALDAAVAECWLDKKDPAFRKDLVALLKRATSGESISGREVADMYATAASSPGAGAGLIVIVDELGKYLEHVAAAPTSSDVGVLQDLAETANRSGSKPILLVTLLHQAFERYAGRLTPLERDEWSKVQGRFEDIVFHDSPEQILRIIASAIAHTAPNDVSDDLHASAVASANRAADCGMISGALSIDELRDLSVRCYPLHPSVALQIGYAFRRLAQNERSLFAFLGGHEPHGLREFLTHEVWDPANPPYYRLDNLYEYLISSLGGALYSGPGGKRWADVETCLERHNRGTALERRVIKAVGLLQALGSKGAAKASREFLRYALTDANTTDAQIDAALNVLVAGSIIVYRAHAGAYGLWEGSDIDLEARLQEAYSYIDSAETLVRLLAQRPAPRPFVARRHSVETGTLRYFEVRYVDQSTLDLNYHTPSADGDGLILCALPNSDGEAAVIVSRASGKTLASKDDVLIAVPKRHAVLLQAARELAALQWIGRNTPELASDLTARRELNARLTEVSQFIESQLQSLFGDDGDGHASCTWYYKGKQLEGVDGRAFNRMLSELCDGVYNHSPRVLNELINRRHLSSAAAAARRSLMEAMLTKANTAQLGIEGYPPELSMYRSVLEVSGIHREEGGRWGIHRPQESSPTRLHGVWQAFDDFFETTTERNRSAEELSQFLQSPPYGVKAGLLPVLLLAYLQCHHDEIAVYELNTFLPRLSMANLERLMKTPKDFTFHKASLSGAREAVYDSMIRALQSTVGVVSCDRNLLNLVRPLCKLIDQLPGYARKTKSLSPGTLSLREAILSAREPDRLVFVGIPEAYGLPPVLPDASFTDGMMAELESALKASVEELQGAYKRLLDEIENGLRGSLQFAAATRTAVASEAMKLMGHCADTRLKGLLIRLSDDDSNQREWLESVGDHLAGKNPETWTDDDYDRYQIGLMELGRRYRHLRALVFEPSGVLAHAEQAYRIGLTQLGKVEREQVIMVDKGHVGQVRRTVDALRAQLAKSTGSRDRNVQLAALAQLVGEMLEDDHTQGKKE